MSRNFYPQRRPSRVEGPSRLADLDGRRAPGQRLSAFQPTKAPKRRFKIGDRFMYDGPHQWEIIYMYRVRDEPGVWFHCIEEQKDKTVIGAVFETIGAGSTTERVIFNEFATHGDARDYFSDLYRHGDSAIKSTQELIKLGVKNV